jgi:effector-binding domain-containing protein
MRSVLILCIALMIGISAVWAADEPAKPATPAAAAAPAQPMIKMSTGTAKLVGEPAVKEFPAMKAVVAFVKAADYTPEGGYTKDEAGMDKAYEAMMKDGFDKLMKWCHATGMWPAGPGFALFFEDPTMTEPGKLTAKVAFPAGADAKAAEGVTPEEIPAMTAVMLQYQGPYEEGNNAWTAVMGWTAKNGYEMAGPPMEVYLKGPMDVKDAKEYLTEIRLPVKKVEAKTGVEAATPSK